jgi:hypothetical protein
MVGSNAAAKIRNLIEENGGNPNNAIREIMSALQNHGRGCGCCCCSQQCGSQGPHMPKYPSPPDDYNSPGGPPPNMGSAVAASTTANSVTGAVAIPSSVVAANSVPDPTAVPVANSVKSSQLSSENVAKARINIMKPEEENNLSRIQTNLFRNANINAKAAANKLTRKKKYIEGKKANKMLELNTRTLTMTNNGNIVNKVSNIPSILSSVPTPVVNSDPRPRPTPVVNSDPRPRLTLKQIANITKARLKAPPISEEQLNEGNKKLEETQRIFQENQAAAAQHKLTPFSREVTTLHTGSAPVKSGEVPATPSVSGTGQIVPNGGSRKRRRRRSSRKRKLTRRRRRQTKRRV